jgi:hypothetical protein
MLFVLAVDLQQGLDRKPVCTPGWRWSPGVAAFGVAGPLSAGLAGRLRWHAEPAAYVLSAAYLSEAPVRR